MTKTVVQNGNENDSALVASFKAARRVSTPIVAIETPDPAATIITLSKGLPPKTPTLAWDIARGLRGLNDYGKAAKSNLQVDGQSVGDNPVVNPTEALLAIESAPQESVVFFHNFHLQLREANGATNTPNVQALWNLRDIFKTNKRMVVMLGPVFELPAELSGDVIVLIEPLPTREELSAVLDQQHKNANLPLPSDEVRGHALDAIVGLASYTAEQVTAMALETKGVSIPKLWERKIATLQKQGLAVYKPQPNDTTIDELKGLDNVVEYCRELIAVDAFNLIVFLDEMDKSFAGGMSEHTGDSGVSKDQVGQLLTYINDTKSLGIMLAGIAGTGKTQLAKAIGAASGKPVVILDLGGAKAAGGGILGQAEGKIRNMLKVITATAEGKVLFIGTANRTTLFTPEMNRRFRKQFFFDLPSEVARKAIWAVYAKKNNLTASQAAVPAGFDNGWTGAEIQAACEEAALFGKTVVKAASYIIPQAVSAKAVIAQMRRESAGKFLSASHEGWYQAPAGTTDAPVKAEPQRSIEMQ